MTQSKFENLSALVDGEESSKHLVESLVQDKALQDKWQRYHLIKDGLKDELPEQLNIDIAQRVAAALENEPAILAPKPNNNNFQTFGAGVVSLFRQGGQFAVAASVAVAVILGYQQFNQPPIVDPALNVAPTITVQGIQGGLSPVSLEQTRAAEVTDAVEKRRKINALLLDHEQQILMKNAGSSDADKNVETDKEDESQPQPEN